MNSDGRASIDGLAHMDPRVREDDGAKAGYFTLSPDPHPLSHDARIPRPPEKISPPEPLTCRTPRHICRPLALDNLECQKSVTIQKDMDPMNFRPLHDRVLVKRLEAEEKTAGGIIIPDTAKEKPQEGEVVAIGTGTRAENGTITPLDVKTGDKILFGKWSGTEVKVDGEDLLIMKESDILGIVG
jgi:chaperonin GroES